VIDHRLVNRFPVLRRLEQDFVGLGPVHQALVDEKVGDALVIHYMNDEFRMTNDESMTKLE